MPCVSCPFNILIYPNVTDIFSSFSSSPQHINDDKKMLEQTFGKYYSCSPKSTMKLVRLGKVRSDNVRPLKMVLLSKDHTISFLRWFNEAKLKSIEFPTSFQNVRDKIEYEWGLIWACHFEIERRDNFGEVGLQIRYMSGVPKIVQNI